MGISTVIADTGRRTKRAVLALAASAAMLVAGIAAAQASCQILADSWIQPPMLAPTTTRVSPHFVSEHTARKLTRTVLCLRERACVMAADG